MAIRAVISVDVPAPSIELQDLWVGSLGSSGDDGVGLTTAAILTFFPDAEPGTWYRLADFSKMVDAVEWDGDGEPQWTSLEITENAAGGERVVAIDLSLSEAVKAFCTAAVDHLNSFAFEHIWIRFE